MVIDIVLLVVVVSAFKSFLTVTVALFIFKNNIANDNVFTSIILWPWPLVTHLDCKVTNCHDDECFCCCCCWWWCRRWWWWWCWWLTVDCYSAVTSWRKAFPPVYSQANLLIYIVWPAFSLSAALSSYLCWYSWKWQWTVPNSAFYKWTKLSVNDSKEDNDKGTGSLWHLCLSLQGA